MIGEQSEQSTSEILNGFAGLLKDHTEASELRQVKADEAREKRQAKSDEKIDTLVDSINTLATAHIETKKDREFDVARVDRIESNLKDLSEDIKDLSNTVLLINERQSTSKDSKKDNKTLKNTIIGGVAIVIIVGVLSLVFSYTINPKKQEAKKVVVQ